MGGLSKALLLYFLLIFIAVPAVYLRNVAWAWQQGEQVIGSGKLWRKWDEIVRIKDAT